MPAPSPKRRSNVVPIVLTIVLSLVVLMLGATAIVLALIRAALKSQPQPVPPVDSSSVAESSAVDSSMTEPTPGSDDTSYTEEATEVLPVQTEEPSADDEEAWVQYYQQMLDQFCASSSDPENVRFDLMDLDNDGIPELFLSEGEYHLAHVLMYSYYNGLGRQIEGIYGSYGEVLYDEDTGLLIDTDMTQGYYYRADYHYYHGELTNVFYCSDNEGAVENEFERQYMLNGEAVSADVYYAEMDRRTLDDAISLGREYSPYGEE